MIRVSTDNKVRALTIYLQQGMEPDPVALFSLVDGAGNGNIFGVYSLKFGYVNGTQVGIEAQSVVKTTADDIFCSYVIIGKPVKKQ